MLGAHATLQSQIKPVKLAGRYGRITAVLILLAVLGTGAWWSAQSGLLSQWLPAAAPVTAASGDIIVEQAPAGIAADAAAVTAETAAVAAGAETVTLATATLDPATLGAATGVDAPAAITEEPVVIAGVAGVNGAAVWDDAGSLLTTLDSGALLEIKASAASGGWLLVDTPAGEGWTPAADVIAYGLGRLQSALLPGVVAGVGAATPAVAAAADGAATEAATVVEASLAPAEVATVADSAALSLSATVAGTGSNLNIRSGPGAEYAVIAKAADGASGQAVGRSDAGDWLLLQLSDAAGATGWASAAYLQVNGDLQSLPVVAAQ